MKRLIAVVSVSIVLRKVPSLASTRFLSVSNSLSTLSLSGSLMRSIPACSRNAPAAFKPVFPPSRVSIPTANLRLWTTAS